MYKLKNVTKPLMWSMALLLVALATGCSNNGQSSILGTGTTISTAKAITAFSFVGFPANPGVINEPAKTIAVTLPAGTAVTALTANFTTGASSVKIGTVVQTSGAAPTNNFTAPVTYRATAADASFADYVVTVTVTPPLSSIKTITAFSFAGLAGSPGVINEPAKTISVTLPAGTAITALTANFSTVASSVKIGAVVQTSGAAPTNNFTAPVTYRVTAADASFVDYVVTVTVTPPLSSIKTITAFSFVGFGGSPGVINEPAKTISVTLPAGTAVTTLTANFTTVAPGVKIGALVQTSGAAPSNDFTAPVTYRVTAADASFVDYVVTVTVTPPLSSIKTITAFSFVGLGGSPGVINEPAKTIAVTLPTGTAVTALTANFTTVAPGVKIGAVVQTSGGAPTNDFTAPVTYRVTAADASFVDYVVTVTVTPPLSSIKTITAFSFVGLGGSPGVINEPAKTISVTLPTGTAVTALTANFSTVAPGVKIGAVVQTSGGAPANDFTAPVTYRVTAADASFVDYVVTVTVTPALSSIKTITAFSFVGLGGSPGVINEPAKTISVTLPTGTAVTALTANFTTVAPGVKIGAVVQTSGGAPANDFTTPVTYRVTAADASFVDYVVTVTVTPALSSIKTITAFSFVGLGGSPGVINEPAKTISVTLPTGTAITALTANFTTIAPSVKIGAVIQTSGGAPANDFTTPVTYRVTAADASFVDYVVSVTVTPALSSIKSITAFSFVAFPAAAGVINEPAKTISVTLPTGSAVTALTANFTTVAPSVKIGAVVQTNGGAPSNDFTAPLTYRVTAADASFVDYVVTVTVTPPLSAIKSITAFSFVGLGGSPGVINEPAKTIAVTLPSGTAVTTLTANFTTAAPDVKIGAVVQTSGGAPTNDFTTPVTYRVTAADASFVDYVVTVTVTPALSSVKTITAFSFVAFPTAAGVINELAKTITVTLPAATVVTALTANFTTVAPGVKIGAVVQTSGGAPSNDFTAPLTYRVTAADASFVDYVVTVIFGAPVTVLPGIAGTPGAAATNPTVIIASPSNGDTNVPLQTQNNLAPYAAHVKWVKATFNEPMDPLTINEAVGTTALSTFSLKETISGINVPGTVTMDATSTMATFKPIALSLTAGTQYTATITTAAKNAGSITPMPNPVAWSFTTMAASFPNQAVPFISQDPVDLLSTANFVILAKTAITDVPASIITGDIGLSPASGAFIGVSCPEVTGVMYAVDVAGPACSVQDTVRMTAAISDALTAFNEAAARPIPDATELGAGNISGLTFYPGLYKWSTFVNINTDITLDAQGDTNAVWIFQIAGDLTIAAGGTVPTGIKVNLIGGAKAANVYWQVGGLTGATLNLNSTFNGNILSAKQVVAITGAVVTGRIFADSQVTLQMNTITKPAP